MSIRKWLMENRVSFDVGLEPIGNGDVLAKLKLSKNRITSTFVQYVSHNQIEDIENIIDSKLEAVVNTLYEGEAEGVSVDTNEDDSYFSKRETVDMPESGTKSVYRSREIDQNQFNISNTTDYKKLNGVFKSVQKGKIQYDGAKVEVFCVAIDTKQGNENLFILADEITSPDSLEPSIGKAVECVYTTKDEVKNQQNNETWKVLKFIYEVNTSN